MPVSASGSSASCRGSRRPRDRSRAIRDDRPGRRTSCVPRATIPMRACSSAATARRSCARSRARSARAPRRRTHELREPTAIVFYRPLPYLYLARQVLDRRARAVSGVRRAAAGGRAVRGPARPRARRSRAPAARARARCRSAALRDASARGRWRARRRRATSRRSMPCSPSGGRPAKPTPMRAKSARLFSERRHAWPRQPRTRRRAGRARRGRRARGARGLSGTGDRASAQIGATRGVPPAPRTAGSIGRPMPGAIVSIARARGGARPSSTSSPPRSHATTTAARTPDELTAAIRSRHRSAHVRAATRGRRRPPRRRGRGPVRRVRPRPSRGPGRDRLAGAAAPQHLLHQRAAESARLAAGAGSDARAAGGVSRSAVASPLERRPCTRFSSRATRSSGCRRWSRPRAICRRSSCAVATALRMFSDEMLTREAAAPSDSIPASAIG